MKQWMVVVAVTAVLFLVMAIMIATFGDREDIDQPPLRNDPMYQPMGPTGPEPY